ncbi:MAG: carbamoyltransferase C-terminal domain-containing protein [Aggregatilineales bacterium]
MKVLGLGTEGDSGAAIIEDGRIIAAINEERLARLKLVTGFPRASILEVLRLSNTSVDELSAVLIGGKDDLLVDELEPFDGWFQYKPSGIGGIIKRSTHLFARYRNELPFLETAYYTLLEPTFQRRRAGLRQILEAEFGITCPIEFVDHHFCHITSAYYTSGFDDALVISLDGGGDAKSGRVYTVRDGVFESLDETATYNSLGNYYAYVTHMCGFKAMKHEGKITGLAAHGEPKYLDLLREFIVVEEGRLVNKGRVVFQSAIDELGRRLPKGWTREDMAASIQVHFEELTASFVQYWARKTGLRKVAVAGGVFANVRVNQVVHELAEVDEIHIHPHMGDGGLAVGAGLAACVPGTLERTMPAVREPIADVYLGTELTDEAILAAFRKFGLEPEAFDGPIEEMVADLLVQGHVVARANGRMEYGPRALGNRSILYQPTDRSVNDWLNHNLRRTEFMPFAPSTLYEERERCFENVAGADHAAEFMTITFDCTPWMRESMEGVVHVDGTARPHLVRKDRNPSFYRIIEAFYERTGLPAIINTSFNMHEEPIVCSAEDCVRAFISGNLDYLAIGNYLVKHPEGVNHALQPVAGMHSA